MELACYALLQCGEKIEVRVLIFFLKKYHIKSLKELINLTLNS